jgi:transaldolase
LAIEDVQMACDIFRPVYERTAGRDGFVSIEVSPRLARDTQGAQEEVRRLYRGVHRPNVMIKVPATKEGLPVIEKSLGEGININITLIFSLKRYEEVIEAWLSGLGRLAKQGKSLSSVASVASFFVSRVDALVDSLLEKEIAQAAGEHKKALESLRGKAAIANAQGAYRIFEKMIASPEFKALETQGAQVQRPLWASTSTKNPTYRDVLYVEELIGKRTVNTLPLATIDHFRDHGVVAEKLPADAVETESTMQRLAQAGIHMDQVTDQLEKNGIELFSKSYDELIGSIRQKRQALTAPSK